MGTKRKYSDEELLNVLKYVLIENPNITEKQFKETDGLPQPDVYIKYFGSWNNAKKLTGVDFKFKASTYTDEELIEILKRELEKNPKVRGNYFKNENGLPNARLYHKRFGSWNKAKELAGSKEFVIGYYTDEELIETLRIELIKNPKLTQLELDKIEGIPHSRTYNTRFGWNKAKELTGVKYENTKQKQTDEELLTILKNQLDKNPDLTIVEFNKIDNTPSYATYIDRFGSWNDAKIMCGSEKVFSRKYTDEELLDYLRDYNNKHGFPETTCFDGSKDTPCFQLYYLKFGSWTNALNLAGIKIPQEKQKYYNNRNYTESEILEELQMLVDSYLEESIFLPSKSYFTNSKIISEATIYKFFGGIKETYKMLGYDNYKEFNKQRLEEDMIEKYIEIKEALNHFPNQVDINRFKKSNPNYYYGSTTYISHFGSIADLQLRLFGEEYKKFYSRKKTITTPNGTKCLSLLEYAVALMLEENKYSFDKDVLYKKYIKSLKTKHSTDFVIYKNNKFYFIEVFGLMDHLEYAEKAKWKIQLCKDNNIPLLELYPKDISMSQFDELSDTIRKFVEN